MNPPHKIFHLLPEILDIFPSMRGKILPEEMLQSKAYGDQGTLDLMGHFPKKLSFS